MAAKESTTIPREHGTRSTTAATTPDEPQPTPQHCRLLKVGYAYTDPEKKLPSRPVPHLRLAGRWLKDAGFTIGQHVKIEVNEGRLTIEPVA